MNDLNIDKAYKYYIKNISKYNIYINYNKKDFINIFKSNNIAKTFIIEENNKIIGLFSFIINSYKINNNYVKIADIQILICFPYRDLINIIKNLNINWISCIDIMNNKEFINKYDFYESVKLYFQMYNFHVRKKFKKNKFGFNLP